MSASHDEVVEFLDRGGSQQRNVVLDLPPIENGLLVPIADAQDLTQLAMIFGQVLQLVVVEVAAQPHRGQDDDFPIVQPFAAERPAGGAVDILADEIEQGLARWFVLVEVLQGLEDGNELVAALQV